MSNDIIHNLIPAKEILDDLVVDTYDEFGVMRRRFGRWLARTWDELSQQLIKIPRKAIIPISPSTMTAMLPHDCDSIDFIGLIDENYELIPLHINRNLAPRLGVTDFRHHCTKCNAPDLCNLLQVETVTETITIDGTDYTKTTNKILKPNGNYIEEIEEPVPYYDNQELVEVTMRKSVKTLCDLPVDECGCIEANSLNIAKLCACGSSNAYCLCTDMDLDKAFQVVGDRSVSYNLFESEGYIQFSNDHCLNAVFISYNGTGLCRDGMYYYPRVAREALIAGSYFKSIEKKQNIVQAEKFRAERAYVSKQKIILRILTRQSIQDIVEAFIAPPRIPTYQ